MQRCRDASLAIIAGGRGSRLGATPSPVPKGLLAFSGRTVLERLLELAPRFEEAYLVANDAAPYARYGLRAVPDVIPGRGAPGGVHAALSAARTAWVLAVGCDMPFVEAAAVEVLLAARAEDLDVVCFEVEGRPEPLLAAYRAALADVFGPALEAHPSFRQLFSLCRVRLLPESALRAVDPELRSIVSINRPEDLARWGGALPDRG